MYSTSDEYVMIKHFWSQGRKASKLGLRVKIRVFVLRALRHMRYHRLGVVVNSVLPISIKLLKAAARWSPDVSGKVLVFLHSVCQWLHHDDRDIDYSEQQANASESCRPMEVRCFWEKHISF